MERLFLDLDCYSRLLDILPRRDIAHLAPLMTLCRTETGQVLMKRGEPVSHVYLPYDAVLATVMECGSECSPQICSIGNEGFTPIQGLFGADDAADTVICIVEGTCARIRMQDFRSEVECNARLRLLTEQYMQAYQIMLRQRVACSRLHTLTQRYACALLSIQDRINGCRRFKITQDFMANLLGVRRPSLNVVAREFQQAGVIAYSRGHMEVLDRQQLEHAACECYAGTRRGFERLLGIRVG